jgi:hypothetical protein
MGYVVRGKGLLGIERFRHDVHNADTFEREG